MTWGYFYRYNKNRPQLDKLVDETAREKDVESGYKGKTGNEYQAPKATKF
jgi:hypothetical protein